eukprot:12935760-Heterocapsa_arctica.AAC.2
MSRSTVPVCNLIGNAQLGPVPVGEARRRGALCGRSSVFLWEVVLPLSIATWNVPGLFGSVQASHSRVRWKQQFAAGLLSNCQVVAMQEVHGNRAD